MLLFCHSHVGQSGTENGTEGQPEEFPADACYGAEYGRGHRYLSGGRDIPGNAEVIFPI